MEYKNCFYCTYCLPFFNLATWREIWGTVIFSVFSFFRTHESSPDIHACAKKNEKTKKRKIHFPFQQHLRSLMASALK